MNVPLELLINIGIIYTGIFIGYILKRIFKSEKLKKIFTFASITILTPVVLIFLILDIEDFNLITWGIVIILAISTSLVSLIIDWFLLLKNSKMTKEEKGAEINAVSFMNSLSYPFPIILAVIGLQGLQAATIFYIVNVFLRNSLGAIIGVIYGSKEKIPIVEVLKNIFLFPPFIGLIIGIILRLSLGYVHFENELPLEILRYVFMITLLLLIGLNFQFPKKTELDLLGLLRAGTARFGGGFILSIVIFFLPFTTEIKIPLIVQSITPPAIINIGYASYLKLDPFWTSKLITFLTLFALIFLPLEIYILLLLA